MRDVPVPIDKRYFEDYVPGAVFEYGTISVNQADLIEFAKRFDPQPFHIDPDAAARGPFGGLIASGWHTASLVMRLLVDRYLSSVASLGSPGVDELRWTRPVRPGDSLRVRVSVLDARRSRSKPDRGLVRSHFEVVNQDGDVVMSLKALNFLRCREMV
jgi:acyl dehydratase